MTGQILGALGSDFNGVDISELLRIQVLSFYVKSMNSFHNGKCSNQVIELNIRWPCDQLSSTTLSNGSVCVRSSSGIEGSLTIFQASPDPPSELIERWLSYLEESRSQCGKYREVLITGLEPYSRRRRANRNDDHLPTEFPAERRCWSEDNLRCWKFALDRMSLRGEERQMNF
jgi:hypothetical protein